MMHNGTGHVPPPPVPPPGPPQPPVSNNNNGHQPEPPLQNGTIATGMDARLVPNYESLVPAAAVIRRVAGHLNLMLSKLMLRQSRNRNSTDQRMEVLEHVASARLLLAKTMAALAWAREGRAGAYVTAQALISMLDNQITAFEFAAMKLADTARVLAQQAEASRNPDVPTAVDVLASGSYLRFPLTLTNTLPNGFLPLPAPDDDADDEDVNAHAGSVTLTTDTIHDAIRYRLVTLEPAIPDVWLANHVISNGQVTFISPGAFAVSLTLPLGHDPKGKWALTDLTILDTNVVMRPDHHFALMQLGRHTLEKVVAPEQAHVPGATSAAGTGPTATATGGGAGHAATPPPALPLLELHGMYHAIVQSLRFERLQHDATHMLARFPRSMSQPRVTHLTSMRVERDMSIEYWAGSKLSHTLEIMLRPAAASATRRLVNLSGMLAAEKDAAPTARVVSAEVDTNNVEVLLSHRGRVAMVPPNVTMEDLFMACLAEDSQRALQQFARMLGANAVFHKGSLRFVDHHFVVSITRDKGYLHVDTVNGYHPKDTIKQLTSAIVNDPLQLEEGLLQLRVTKLLNDLENECQLAGLIPSSPTRKNRWHLVFARANAAPPLVLDEQFVVKVLEAPRLPLYRLVLFPDEQGVGYSCIVGHLPTASVVKEFTPSSGDHDLATRFRQIVLLDTARLALQTRGITFDWTDMHHLRSDLDDLVPGSGLAFDVLQLEISIGQSGQGLFAFSVAIQSHLPITPALLATRLVCKTVDELAGRIVQVITTAWIVGRTQFLAPLMSIHDDWSAVTYALKLRGAAAAPATVPAVHVRFRVTPAASVDRQAVAKLRMHRRAASSSSSSAPAAHTPRFVEWIPLVVSELAVLVAPDPAVVKVSAAAMDPLRVLIHDHTLSATASPTAIADALRAAMVWGHVLAWVETDLAPASLLGPEFPRAVMRSLSSAAVWLSHEIVIHLTLMAPGAVVIECPAWVSTAVLLREMQSGTAAAGDTTSSMMLSSATLVARPTSVVVALSLLPAVLAAYARLHANNSTLFVVHDVLVARQQPSWAVEKFKLGMKPATDDLAQKRTDAERASAADRPAALAAVAAATRTFDAAKAAALAAMKFSGLLVLEVSIDTVRVSAPLRFPQSQGQLLGTLVCDGRRVVVVPPPSGTDGAAGAAAPIPKEQLAIYTQAQDLISDTCTRALAAAVATGDSPRARAPTVAGFQAALSAMLQLPMPALAVLARAMAALREATSSVPNGANGHDNTDLPPGPVLLLQPPPRSAISPRSAADATVLPEHPASCLLLSRLAAVRFVIEPVPGVLVPLMYDTPREAVMAWPASSGGAATSSGPGSLAASSSAGAGAGSGVAAPSHSGSAMRAMGASALLAQLSSSSPAPIANGGGEPADATAATATASTGDGAEDTGAEAGTAVMVPEHSVAEILSEVKAAGYGSGSGTEPHLVVRDVVLRVLGTRQ